MDQILSYLYGLERFGIKLGLEVTTQLLDHLDNPQDKFKSIHIAGTNGKGSTAAFIAQILQEAGYKIGLYTSPHLVRFNERIKINGRDISDPELIQLVEEIKVKSNRLNPTFFEFTTALAFLHFVRKKVDYAVIEVGMGGRLDATNVIQPEIAVITNVSFDHLQHLGDTLEKIAKEKVEIIKENCKVVTGEKNEKIIKIISKKCQEKGVRLVVTNKPLGKQFNLSLLGNHQRYNAAVAYKVARLLGITKKKIKEGLLKTKWPARLEIISKRPLIIADGAHNVAGMKVLVRFVKQIKHRKVLLLGIAKDKEIAKMVKLIVPLFEKVIISRGNYKPADTSIIAAEARKYVSDVVEVPDVKQAIKTAISQLNDDDFLLITGSLYMVGDVLKYQKEFKG